MGLFIGASVLTILEIFDYLYEVKFSLFILNLEFYHSPPTPGEQLHTINLKKPRRPQNNIFSSLFTASRLDCQTQGGDE